MAERRRFSGGERVALYLAADGRCAADRTTTQGEAVKKLIIGALISAVVHELAEDEIHAWLAKRGIKCPCQ